jgi:hypothetical protein
MAVGVFSFSILSQEYVYSVGFTKLNEARFFSNATSRSKPYLDCIIFFQRIIHQTFIRETQ